MRHQKHAKANPISIRSVDLVASRISFLQLTVFFYLKKKMKNTSPSQSSATLFVARGNFNFSCTGHRMSFVCVYKYTKWVQTDIQWNLTEINMIVCVCRRAFDLMMIINLNAAKCVHRQYSTISFSFDIKGLESFFYHRVFDK